MLTPHPLSLPKMPRQIPRQPIRPILRKLPEAPPAPPPPSFPSPHRPARKEKTRRRTTLVFFFGGGQLRGKGDGWGGCGRGFRQFPQDGPYLVLPAPPALHFMHLHLMQRTNQKPHRRDNEMYVTYRVISLPRLIRLPPNVR